MSYTNIYIDDCGKEIFIQNVSEETVQEVEKNIATIQEFMNETDYYDMLKGNLDDFMEFAEKVDPLDIKAFSKLNRMFINWLNMFYVWEQYHQRYYQPIFEKLSRKYYDGFYEYRMAFHLRRYTTHQRCCITRIEVNLETGDADFLIGIQELLKNGSDMNKKIKEELKQQVDEDDYIEIREFTRNFSQMIEKFQKELWSNEWAIVKKAVGVLNRHIKVENSRIYQSYIKMEGENTKLVDIVQPIFMLYKKFEELRQGYSLTILDKSDL